MFYPESFGIIFVWYVFMLGWTGGIVCESAKIDLRQSDAARLLYQCYHTCTLTNNQRQNTKKLHGELGLHPILPGSSNCTSAKNWNVEKRELEWWAYIACCLTAWCIRDPRDEQGVQILSFEVLNVDCIGHRFHRRRVQHRSLVIILQWDRKVATKKLTIYKMIWKEFLQSSLQYGFPDVQCTLYIIAIVLKQLYFSNRWFWIIWHRRLPKG